MRVLAPCDPYNREAYAQHMWHFCMPWDGCFNKGKPNLGWPPQMQANLLGTMRQPLPPPLSLGHTKSRGREGWHP